MWVSAEMYSAPSIVLQSRRPDGGMHVFDDFREAYAWLRHNTDPSAKVRRGWRRFLWEGCPMRLTAVWHSPAQGRHGATMSETLSVGRFTQ